MEHYLEVLEREPGAQAGSRSLQQWRERGRWPESFDRLWHTLQQRQGERRARGPMIELLSWSKQQGWDRLKNAIDQASGLGCTEAAVRHLLNFGELAHPIREDCDLTQGRKNPP